MPSEHSLEVVSFATELGWIALAGSGSTVKHIVFNYPSRAAAISALDQKLGFDEKLAARASTGHTWASLVARLQDYAAGGCDDFRDVELDLDHLTAFQRRVIKHCRAIGYGRTSSYGALAKASGSQRAARAVGNTMATNRFPLIVPCHRVINADGSIGNYGAPDGTRMKVRLLTMERAPLASSEPRPKKSKKKTSRARLAYA
jgi:methylated-DNA-[protein]-cysteine S-methyltransferase